jgi:VanZ family protein
LGAYWLALVIGTHIPRPPEELLPFGESDKVLHLSAYAGLAFLACLNWSLRRDFTWRAAAGSWIAIVAFGALDEVTQIPVGRQCDPMDWLADACGTLGGIAAFALVRRLRRALSRA